MLLVKKSETQNLNLKTQDSLLAKEAMREAVLRLQAAKIESASLDARIIMEQVLGVTREQLLFSLDLPINDAQYAELKKLVEMREMRKPLAQIIGKREFWGLNFVVSDATLDPRPDSETLVEAVLARLKNRSEKLKILDLGTGTGCLLLSLLSELPNANGVAVDICEKALNIARQNALNLGISDRVQFICSNWAEKLENIEQGFDIIISNPPYIPSEEIKTLAPEVAKFEPIGALDGGVDGFDCYRKIIGQLPKLLAENGFAAFEIGMGQEKYLTKIAYNNGFEVIEIKKDLAGIARCVILKNK